MAGAAIVLGLLNLDARRIWASAYMIGGIMVYLGATQRWPPLRRVVPREFMVAGLFAVGTMLFFWLDVTAEKVGVVTAFTVAFATLCALACVAVSWLERDVDRCRGVVTLAVEARSGASLRTSVLGLALLHVLAVASLVALEPGRPALLAAAMLLLSFAAISWQLACGLSAARPRRFARWTDFLLLPAPMAVVVFHVLRSRS